MNSERVMRKEWLLVGLVPPLNLRSATYYVLPCPWLESVRISTSYLVIYGGVKSSDNAVQCLTSRRNIFVDILDSDSLN